MSNPKPKSKIIKKNGRDRDFDNNGNVAHKVSNFFNNITYQNNIFEFEINLKYIAALNSTYAIRLYKLLKQYQTIKSRLITVEELRLLLSLTDKLKQFSDIRKKVIETAIKQINKSTDLNITYAEHKIGRITKSITFNINKN